MARVPTVVEVRSWLKLADASMTDVELGDVLDGELEEQADACRTGSWPDDPDDFPARLRMALFRRCGRVCAARGIPLGLAGSDEFGQTRLPPFDAEIERLERRLRKFAIG